MSVMAVFFASFLYYGFNNWMPTILKNVFGLSNAKATLLTTLFPMVVYIGSVLSVVLCDKIKNDFLVLLIVSSIAAVVGFVLSYIYDVNVILTVSVILSMGILLRLLCNLFAVLTPLHIREHMNSGKTSALINSSASVAAAVSPSIIALVLDMSGGNWGTGFLMLFLFAIITVATCLTFYIFSKQRKNDMPKPIIRRKFAYTIKTRKK